uniref:YkgJ family cysteine cluster protein n=1 Tax=Ammonifex degensii TaxID=42838 RepID=A0A7C2E3L0_9THEO
MQFNFACQKGLPCFTRCCQDVNIFLSPYDVVRIKNRLGISSEEFLDAYTTVLVHRDSGVPVVRLNMVGEDRKCPFITSEGCSIYTDRPWACRMAPVDVDDAGNLKFILDRTECLGLNEPTSWTLEEWMADQGLDAYPEVEAAFNEIMSSAPLKEKYVLNPELTGMFLMAAYDVDRFRRFVFESGFFKVFDVPAATVEAVRTDDVELLKLGFRWLKFGLLDRNALKIREEEVEARKAEAVKGSKAPR